jgi:phage gp46-like protein
MSAFQDFEGDLLLIDSSDGGDIQIEDGLFVPDCAFGTAVYLSLFGGNAEDAGKVKNSKEWWGNTIDSVSVEKITSRFQAIIAGLPMTTKHIQEAEIAAGLDLAWIKDEGVADEITIDGRAGQSNRFYLQVDIKASGKSIYDNTFSVFWKAGVYGGF